MSNTCCLQSQEQYRHVFYRKRPVLLYLITWAHLHHNINWYWETGEDLNMHLTPISYLEDVEKKQVIRKKARHGKRSINEWLSTDLFPLKILLLYSRTHPISWLNSRNPCWIIYLMLWHWKIHWNLHPSSRLQRPWLLGSSEKLYDQTVNI